MFVESVAFEPVPAYARVHSDVVASVRARLLREPPALQSTLDSAFRAMEDRQPAVASFISNELAGIEEPGVQGIAYFLAVLVVDVFEDAFGPRLGSLELADLGQALERLIADGEVRSGGAAGQFYSEDALALGQPALVKLVRTEIDRAVASSPAAPDGGSPLDAFYESLLVVIVALTQSVAP